MVTYITLERLEKIMFALHWDHQLKHTRSPHAHQEFTNAILQVDDSTLLIVLPTYCKGFYSFLVSCPIGSLKIGHKCAILSDLAGTSGSILSEEYCASRGYHLPTTNQEIDSSLPSLTRILLVTL